MPQSLLQVRDQWELSVRRTLRTDHRVAFLRRPETTELAALPRLVIQRAAAETVLTAGELRLTTWLEASRRELAASPPLRVELVPSSCWWSNLRSELPAEEWTVCKRWSSQRAEHRCEVCGDRGSRWPVECHEQWQYLDDARPRVQRLVGLISLCPACHQSTHMGFAGVSGHLEEAMAHLARVNGWDERQADEHVSHGEAVWEERSRHQWTLDVAWLTHELGITVAVSRSADSA